MFENNGKRAWIYYRLSRDEDKEMNSLTNQKGIIQDYAVKNGYRIVGESFDDNISGMHFNREGVDEVRAAALDGLIDVVLVKDMSRLGRHRLETPLFIEMLRKENVKVISVTEGIDTFNESDDLHIAIKQFMNDFYSKDISRKIRSGFKQKQREGMVLMPPFGYRKNLVTKEITIEEECADMVRLMYKLYIDGYGQKQITKYLNDHDYKSPSYYMKLFYNRNIGGVGVTSYSKEYMWNSKTVYEILKNKAYIGILECNKTTNSSIYKYSKYNDESEYIVHKDFYPKILSDEEFYLVQELKAKKSFGNVRANSNKKYHRYAGLIKCGNCGATFTAKRRKDYIEYVCNSYHRNGIAYCSAHRVKEKLLDEIIGKQTDRLREVAKENVELVRQFLEDYQQQKVDIKSSVDNLKKQVVSMEENIKVMIRETINNPDRKKYLDVMIDDDEKRIGELKTQIEKLENTKTIASDTSLGISETVLLLEHALEGDISNAHLQYLVKNIIVTETENSEFDIEVVLNMPFINHYNRPVALDTYRVTDATSP
jgi:site-specific DNA recombinase